PKQHTEHEIEVPQGVEAGGEREEGADEERARRQDQARAVPIARGADGEGDEAADDQVERRRDRDRAAAPAELVRQYRKEHAEPGVRVPDAEHDERARAYHHPALPAGDVGHVVAMILARRRETYRWSLIDREERADGGGSGKRARDFSIILRSAPPGISVRLLSSTITPI